MSLDNKRKREIVLDLIKRLPSYQDKAMLSFLLDFGSVRELLFLNGEDLDHRSKSTYITLEPGAGYTITFSDECFNYLVKANEETEYVSHEDHLKIRLIESKRIIKNDECSFTFKESIKERLQEIGEIYALPWITELYLGEQSLIRSLWPENYIQ